jgi:hypothetical protein
MRVLTQVSTTGHYTTIEHDNISLTIRTERGTPEELAAEAVDMRRRATRLIRNADLIKEAIYTHQEVTTP